MKAGAGGKLGTGTGEGEMYGVRGRAGSRQVVGQHNREAGRYPHKQIISQLQNHPKIVTQEE